MPRRDLATLLALSAVWGASFLFIKVGVEELEPSVVVLGRLVVGVLVLLPLVVLRGGMGAVRRAWLPLTVLGALNNALPFWLLGFAEQRIDSGLTAVIQASAPIFTVLLATRIDRSQRVTGGRLAGVVVGFVGVLLLVEGQRGPELVGALAVCGTALLYAVSILYAGRTVRGLPPVQVSVAQLGVGALLTAPFGLAQLPAELPSGRVLAAVAALGAFGSGLAYLLYFTLVSRAGASRTILVTYLVPAFALGYGALLLGEAVTLRALAGLTLVLAGTATATGLALRRR